jgi:SAM-dependent methyltransferase
MTNPQKPADIAGAAGSVEGRAELASEAARVMQALLTGSMDDPGPIKNVLLRAIENPKASLARLTALQLDLEKTNRLDEQTNKSLNEFKRQLQAMISPPSGPGADEEFDVPLRFRRGANFRTQRSSVDSAVEMIATVASEMDVGDLSGTSILDIGCGVKFTQAFYGRKVPVKRYHGVDVDPQMIKYLSSNVKDDRFSYTHIDIYNARYHRSGKPLSAETDIGTGTEKFDLICLFSVFTHLAPPDYRAMLELAQRYISPTGTFIFTSFIDDSMPEFYKDSDSAQPLLMALYRESAVREFAAAAGWSVKRIFLRGIQHWIVCKPA